MAFASPNARGQTPIRPGVELASLSDVGCQRENNEDRYSYWEPTSEEEFQRKGRLVIVADGMGGYEGGQEASKLAVETLEKEYSQQSGTDPRAGLLGGFYAAHQRIQEAALQNPELHGMGTTCTAAVLLGRNLYYAHIGDSRLYLIRNQTISLISRDHSYVSNLVETGVISSEDAEHHPQRHILTAALGAGNEITPDCTTEPIALEPGNVILLCTDGLWGLVRDEELKEAACGKSLGEACRELVKTAKQRGGPDNITLQMVRLSAD